MAPSARQVQKAEAKYGVATDYPDLQLHSAAANGNIGLVKYALMHGQPVNSVLNGVLPIHIAASSGSELVVQMLIDAGADVNAARLPRKYNVDRAKAASSIGAAGSTPLHFAAANGHANVVTLLLSHGANPDVQEKHGLTAEDLAREGGHSNVIEVIQAWRRSGEMQQQQLVASARRGSEGGESSLTARGDGTSTAIRKLLGSSTLASPRSVSSSSFNPSAGGPRLASSAASMHSVASTSKKISIKPSLESISLKGKKLAKAASNPNLAGLLGGNGSSQHSSHVTHTGAHYLASSFAPTPTALRQNPLRSASHSAGTSGAHNMARQTTVPGSGSGVAPHIHQVINIDKARRPSLPSVFEKAAHPSQSIKQALGMTSSATSGTGGHSSRAGSASGGKEHDPYNLVLRPRRSGSRTSLSSVFRHHGKDRGSNDPISQPLSPAASSFFTGDDELEQAERDAFLQTNSTSDAHRDGSADEGYHQQLSSNYPYSRQYGSAGQGSRARAGSGSSAATNNSGSGRSVSRRGYSSGGVGALGPPPPSAGHHPTTAPPSQTSFFQFEAPAANGSSSDLARFRPMLSPHSSSSSLIIPAPIPPPPSSSTQPFFSKAAISAAHNNPPISRPGFYRPRKSSQLSNSASTLADRSTFLHSSQVAESGSGMHSGHLLSPSYPETAVYDEEDENGIADSVPLTGPSVIVRRPTLQATSANSSASTYRTSRYPSHSHQSRTPVPPPATGDCSVAAGTSRFGSRTPAFSPPGSSSGIRHSRASSDGLSGVRSSLPDVLEYQTFDFRQRSQSHGAPAAAAGAGALEHAGPEEQAEIPRERDELGQIEQEISGQELDPETARESEDTFPTNQERPFATRSRAGSRARVDSIGSASSSNAYQSSGSISGGASIGNASPAMSSGSFQQPPPAIAEGEPLAGSMNATWASFTRPSRSGSTTTDTRTSRSGSLGEGGPVPPRFLNFDYSSSPGSSSHSLYQPSNSTTATSVVSSPPRTAPSASSSVTESSCSKPSTVTHAQAHSMVKRKEEELLSYTPRTTASDEARRPSLSQQLAAYGDSLAMERELLNAEHGRRHSPTGHEGAQSTAKYSWEILGKESRTTMPVTKGQRAKDKEREANTQKLWTHKMVSPYEVPLTRPAGTSSGHRPASSISSIGTVINNAASSSSRPLTKVSSQDTASPNTSIHHASNTSAESPTQSQQAVFSTQEPTLRSKPSSTLSAYSGHLAPPSSTLLGSELAVHRKSPRLPSPSGRSPRSSSEREREKPSTTYHVVAGPGSEAATDSANSSLISEPRSSHRHASGGHHHSSDRLRPSGSSRGEGHHSASQSPETPTAGVFGDDTPRQPQLLRLETVMAPKFHVETRAGGEAAPSPTKARFGKIGRLFK